MISILLPTYNGEKHITGLIESLLTQTVGDFKLIISDDRSTDGTFQIVKEYCAKYPDIILAGQNAENTGGAQYNFMKMMVGYKDDYLMLCDQDDVWWPEKIEKTLAKMKELESAYGASTPLLVHTDLKVVDENLNIISPSYRKMSNTGYKFNALNNLLTMNIPTGCTIMYNRALSDLITAEPGYMVMHDWWLSLTAAAFAKIAAIDEPTVLYRQHSENSVGAKRARSPGYVRYVLTHIDVMAEKINNSYRQAASFLEMYGGKLTEEQKELVTAHASMPGLTKSGKLRTMFKYNTFLYGAARKIAQVIVLICSRN